MVKITNYTNSFFYPSGWDKSSLEEVVIFPGSESTKAGRPGSSVWIFGQEDKYFPEILGEDIGCGIAAFTIPEIEVKEGADLVADYLKGKNILGRGNHFVDLCTGIKGGGTKLDKHMVLLIHTSGNYAHPNPAGTLNEAVRRIEKAKDFREDLGGRLMERLGVSGECFGDWSHNSVETAEGRIIYRKGAIKVIPDGIHLLLVHMGYSVLLYTVHPDKLPLFNSLPHGTGRRFPLNSFKAGEEQIKKLREKVYIPELIPDTSLKSEHPDCYNTPEKIFEKLGEYMLGLGEFEILTYIGKI